MDTKEILLTASDNAQTTSATLYDYNSTNTLHLYKNGGPINKNTLQLIGSDYLIGAETSKPILSVWNTNSQEINKKTRMILPEPANCLSVCPNNVYLAVGMGNKLYIWMLTSGKLLSVQKKHYQNISCVQISKCGGYLVTGGHDGMLNTYKLSDLVSLNSSFLSQNTLGQVEPLYSNCNHSISISGVHIGIFGRKSRLATVSLDKTCIIYNLAKGDILLKIIFNDLLTSVIFDNPCWGLFVGQNNGEIVPFSLRTKPPICNNVAQGGAKGFLGHKGAVSCLSINLSNTILASGGADGDVLLWDISTRQILKKIPHKGGITNLQFTLNYASIKEVTFKPSLTLNPLERSLNVSDTYFAVNLNCTSDLELENSEEVLSDLGVHEKNQLRVENRNLRVVNKQIFDAAVNISKKNILSEH